MTLSLKENFGLFAVVLVLVFVYLGRGEVGLRVYSGMQQQFIVRLIIFLELFKVKDSSKFGLYSSDGRD